MSKVSQENAALAFEYVLGTLDLQEREAFEQQFRRDHSLADEVLFWEQHLEMQAEKTMELAPEPDSLLAIKERINQGQSRNDLNEEKASSILDVLFTWKAATATMFAAFLIVIGINTFSIGTNLTPNTDYVAVLLNETDQPVLTALTASEGQTLHLKWEAFEKPENGSLQLWSKSRRDGVIRPLFVFDEHQNMIDLDQASLRLIQDSSHLLITLEEEGGSPFDEPSDTIIAEGVCVRFSQVEAS